MLILTTDQNMTHTSVINTTITAHLNRIPVEERDPLSIVVPVTIVYLVIFITGLIGNVSTCIVIARNKSMHTATNYYLFSLAVSDLLLLLSGLPPEMYRLWWPQVYIFGELFCMVQSFSAETSTNATILTITAFTVERYIAICHPFLTHTMSKLSRAIKFVVAIWLIALCLAIPQAIQYGMWYAVDEAGSHVSRCTMTRVLVDHAFELSTLVFFVSPMTAITVLYVLIAIKLRRSRVLTTRASINSNNDEIGIRWCQRRAPRNSSAQNRVIKMLVAVVVAFFVCWAPFHAQRLLAVYMSTVYTGGLQPSDTVLRAYLVLNYTSGVLYFLSTTINPLLYNIMSNKFRDAFKTTLAQLCNHHHGRYSATHHRTFSTMSRYPTSFRAHNRPFTDDDEINSPQLQAVISPEHAELHHHHHQAQNMRASCKLLAHNKSRQFRPRGNSTSSQVTVVTSLSTSKSNITRLKNDDKRHWSHVSKRSQKNKTASPISLGALAQRFRMLTIFRPDDDGPQKIERQRSLDSGNTISNSSLQNMDEIEFSSSDLVKYMEEVNCDLA